MGTKSMPIKRALQIWFFTNLIGAMLFMYLSGEKGHMESGKLWLILGLGGLFSLPAIVISGLSIRYLETMPERVISRMCFMLGATIVSIIATVFVFGVVFGWPNDPWDKTGFRFPSLTDLLGWIYFVYPYCIAAFIVTFIVARDLIFISPEDATPTNHHHEYETES
jgi:hypothetical protein